MFLRDAPTATIEDVVTEFDRHLSAWKGGTHNINLHLDAEVPTVEFGDHEVPVSGDGLDALSAFFDVPARFIQKVQPDERQWILNKRIERTEGRDVGILFNSEGLTEVVPAGQRRVQPVQIARVLSEALPADSPVVQYWANPKDLQIDVIVPADSRYGIGGDRAVGDLTHGGVRVVQNRKQNLAPSVQPFTYRLLCTNGMEVPVPGLVMDARGSEVEDIMTQLRSLVDEAYGRVSTDIAAFYDLRTQRIAADRTGLLRRLSQEHGLSERTIGHLEDLLPSHIHDGEEASMFTLVNLVTNAANDPELSRYPAQRRRLEMVGGAIVHEHVERCNACQSRLN